MKTEKPVTVRWIRSEWDEFVMTRIGLRFHQGKIKLSEWNMEKSLHNNARVGSQSSLDKQKSEIIAIAMDFGMPTEMGTFYHTTSGIIAANGNHRGDACLSLGVEEIDCYLLDEDSDPGLIQEYIRMANARTVNNLTEGDRLEQVKYLVNVRQFSIADASRTMCLRVDWVQDQLRAATLSNRLQRLGVNPSSLTTTVILKLAAVCGDNDNNLRAAAALIVNYALPHTSTIDLLNKLRQYRTSESRFQAAVQLERQVLDEIAAERKRTTQVKRVRRPLRTRMLQHLSALYNIMQDIESRESFPLYEAEVPDAIAKVEEMHTKLHKWFPDTKAGFTQPVDNGSSPGKQRTSKRP